MRPFLFWMERPCSGRIAVAGEENLPLPSLSGGHDPSGSGIPNSLEGAKRSSLVLSNQNRVGCIPMQLALRVMPAAILPSSLECRRQQTCYALRASLSTVATWQIHRASESGDVLLDLPGTAVANFAVKDDLEIPAWSQARCHRRCKPSD